MGQQHLTCNDPREEGTRVIQGGGILIRPSVCSFRLSDKRRLVHIDLVDREQLQPLIDLPPHLLAVDSNDRVWTLPFVNGLLPVHQHLL